jgi:hypothetical protein
MCDIIPLDELPPDGAPHSARRTPRAPEGPPLPSFAATVELPEVDAATVAEPAAGGAGAGGAGGAGGGGSQEDGRSSEESWGLRTQRVFAMLVRHRPAPSDPPTHTHAGAAPPRTL